MSDSDIEDLEYLYGKQAPTLQLKSIYPPHTKSQVETEMSPESQYRKFLVVRHPFTRIVSAYRDKLERYTDKYYQEFGIHMVKQYREQALQKFPPEEFPIGYDLDGEEVICEECFAVGFILICFVWYRFRFLISGNLSSPSFPVCPKEIGVCTIWMSIGDPCIKCVKFAKDSIITSSKLNIWLMNNIGFWTNWISIQILSKWKCLILLFVQITIVLITDTDQIMSTEIKKKMTLAWPKAISANWHMKKSNNSSKCTELTLKCSCMTLMNFFKSEKKIILLCLKHLSLGLKMNTFTTEWPKRC